MNNKEYLYKLKQTIEKMDVIHHKEIFSILKNNINISENRNGSSSILLIQMIK